MAWLTIAARIGQAIALPLFAWVMLSILDLREWRAATDSNRWTAKDQANYSSEVAAQQAAVWEAMAQVRLDIARLPPREFVASVERLRERIQALEIEMAKEHGKP